MENKSPESIKYKTRSKRRIKSEEGVVETTNDETSSKKLKRKSEDNDIDQEAVVKTEGKNDDTKQAPKKSKRLMKKERAQQREEKKKEASKQEAAQKALNYISKWKHAKSEWKFEKLRQIWLMDNFLDINMVPDSIFPTVLEYFERCKGMAREQLLRKGIDIIRKVEEDQENRGKIMESVEYKRARQLLQALPTET